MLSALWGAEIPNGCWTVALLCHVWAVQCFKHDSMPQSSCLLWPGKIFDNMLLCDVFLTLDPVSVVNFTMQNCPRCASIGSLAATEGTPLWQLDATVTHWVLDWLLSNASTHSAASSIGAGLSCSAAVKKAIYFSIFNSELACPPKHQTMSCSPICSSIQMNSVLGQLQRPLLFVQCIPCVPHDKSFIRCDISSAFLEPGMQCKLLLLVSMAWCLSFPCSSSPTSVCLHRVPCMLAQVRNSFCSVEVHISLILSNELTINRPVLLLCAAFAHHWTFCQ